MVNKKDNGIMYSFNYQYLVWSYKVKSSKIKIKVYGVDSIVKLV
jgi:hypothetical protein